MPCRATQDGWVMVESSDKIWSTGEGNGSSLFPALRTPWTVWTWPPSQSHCLSCWNQVTIKPSTPSEFMIYLYIQNFIPFLVLPLLPSGLRSIKSEDSLQFSSVTQLHPPLCDPMNCSTPGLPVHHQLPEFTQTHVHWVGDAIQTSHPLSSLLLLPSIFPSTRVFSRVSSSHQNCAWQNLAALNSFLKTGWACRLQ